MTKYELETFFQEIRSCYKEKYGKPLNPKNDWMEKKLAELLIFPMKIDDGKIIGYDISSYMPIYMPKDWQEECERIVELLHIQKEACHEKDPLKKYQLLIKTIPEDFKRKFPDTLKFHVDYIVWLINRRENDVRETGHAFKSLWIMLVNMNREIADYSNMELAELVQKECFATITRQHAIWFLQYIYNNAPEKLKFNLEISLLRRDTIRREDDFYTPEEWRAFAQNLFDTDRHLEKACADWLYAQYWLYTLLHMSLTWRKSDILNMPSLEGLPEFSRYIQRLRSGKLFSDAEAQGIINYTKLSAEQYHTRKTRAKKHFNIPQIALVPTAAALIICEHWRREKGCAMPFKKFRADTAMIKEKLGLEKEFLSLKANRTLLSMFNETAGDMDGVSGMAATLASYMRSHKIPVSGHADVTTVYLRSTYDERETISMGKQNIDRGMFGWLYDRLIEMAGCRRDSFKENTELIAKMKEAIPPQKAEGIAGAFYGILKERDALLDELYTWHEDEINEKTNLLLSGKLLSRVDDVYCIQCGGIQCGDGQGGCRLMNPDAGSRCPYPTEDKCLLCRYAIPTAFSLSLAGDELKRLLIEIGETNEKDTIDRIRLTYQIGKMVTTLREASEKFGREYVETYINFEEINILLKTEAPKMIFVEDKRNGQ